MTTQTLEPKLIEALRQTAEEILETMVFLVPRTIESLPEEQNSFRAPVIGLLGFTGTRSGTFVVRTDETVARTITAKMLMMEPSEIASPQEAADGFGELVNMLAGNFKNAWVAGGNQMELSVPTVIHNGSVQVRAEGVDSLRSRVRVTLDQGAIDIGVHFETTH